MGDCPQLEVLLHSARGATAPHLRQYMQLQSLSDLLCAALPTCSSLVMGLTPLTRLQHLHLSQCDLRGSLIPRSPCFAFPKGFTRAMRVVGKC